MLIGCISQDRKLRNELIWLSDKLMTQFYGNESLHATPYDYASLGDTLMLSGF